MSTHTPSQAQPLPPPTERYSILGWMHKNLFSTWYNGLLTILTLGLIYAILKPEFNWFITQAEWEVVQVNMRLLMVGQYPQEQIWRIWLCLYLLAAIAGLSWGVWVRGRWLAGIELLVVPMVINLQV